MRDSFAAAAAVSRSVGREGELCCAAAAAGFLGRCVFFFLAAAEVGGSFADWADALASGADLVALALALVEAPVAADFGLPRRFLLASTLVFSEAFFSES